MLSFNDDKIICRGILNLKSYLLRIVLLMLFIVLVSFGFGLITLPCLIPMYIAYVENWELYLTPTDIHYSANCGYSVLPLSQVNHISVIPCSSTILINTKNPSVYATSNSVTVANEFRIPHVENCQEFVAAVKAEMTLMNSQSV